MALQKVEEPLRRRDIGPDRVDRPPPIAPKVIGKGSDQPLSFRGGVGVGLVVKLGVSRLPHPHPLP
jgi:hypothetical protein